MSRKKVQVFDVLGERVSLVPTGIPESESYLVSFTQKYVPENTSDKDVETMKKIFYKVFLNPQFQPDLSVKPAPGDAKDPLETKEIKVSSDESTPLPPCNEDEKNMLTKAFQRRLELLQIDIANEKRREEDTVRLRQLSGHTDRIQRFLQQTGCHKYMKSSTIQIEELDDERIKRLLKQFVFLLLQGQHPLEDYEDRLPVPKEFIDNLEQDIVEDFDGFLKSYRDQQYPIAARIAKVLQVAELDLNAIEAEINAGVAAKINIIINDIKKLLPEKDPIWQGDGDIRAIFDRLLERLREKEADLQEKEKTIQTLQAEKAACEAKQKENEDLIGILKGRISNLEAELSAAKESANAKGTESEGLKSAMTQAQADIEKYKQIIAGLQAENKAINDKYAGLEERLKALEEEIRRLRQTIEQLEAKNKDLSALEDINKKLSEELEGLRKAAQEKSALQEQLAAITTALEESKAQKKTLEEQGAAKDNEISQLRTDAARLEGEKASLSQEKEAAQAELAAVRAACEKEKETMKEQHAAAIDAAEAARDAALAAAEQSRQDAEAASARAAADAAQAQASLNALREQCNKEKEEMEARHTAAIAAAQAEVQRLQARITELEGQISTLQTEKTGFQTQISNLETKKEELQQEIATLQADITRQSEEFSAKIQKLIEAKASLETEKQELTEQLAAAQQNSEAKSARISALEARIDELEKQKEELETEAKHRASEIDELEEEITTITSNLETKDSEIRTLTSNTQSKDAEISRLKNQLVKLTEERDAKLAELVQKDSKIQGLEITIQTLKSQIVEKDSRIASLEGELANTKVMVQQKNKQIETLTQQITSLESKSGVNTSQLQTLRKSLQDITQQRDQLLAKVAELESQIETLKKQVEKVSSDSVETLRKTKEDCDTKLKVVEEKLTQALAREGKKNTNATELRTLLEQQKQKILELEALQAKSTQSIASLQEERNILLAEKTALIKKIEGLEAQIKQMAERIESILAGAQAQESKNQELTSQLAQKEAEKEALSKQLADSLQKLESSITALKEEHRKAIGAQKSEYENKLLEKEGVISKQRQDISNLGAALTKAGQEAAELKEMIAKLQQANEALNAEIQRLKQELETKQGLENELRACQEAKKALEERATASELEAAKLAELQAQIEGLEQTIVEVRAEKEAVETKAGEEKKEAEAKLAEKVEAIGSLQAEIQRINAALEESRQENKNLQAKCDDAIRRVNEENAALKQEVARLQEELEKSRADHLAFTEKTKEEAEAAVSQLTAIETKYKSLEGNVAKIVSWIENPDEDLVLGVSQDDPLEQLLTKVKGVLRRPSVSVEDEKRTEMTTQRSFCYLMFMTANLWTTYFHDNPSVSESQKKLKNLLDGTLYFPYILPEMTVAIPDDMKFQGIYEKIKMEVLKKYTKPNVDTLVNRKVIDILVKVLGLMTSIMFSPSDNVYLLQTVLDKTSDEESILQMIESVLKEHVVHFYGSIENFHQAMKLYIETVAADSYKGQSNVFLTLSPSATVLQAVAKPGSDTKVLYSSDEDISRIEARDKALPMTKMNMNEGSLDYLKTQKVLNYPSVLFLFLFSMRDYLHHFRGYDKGCPLPSFLKRAELRNPQKWSRVQGVAAAAVVPPPVASQAPKPSTGSDSYRPYTGPPSKSLHNQPAFIATSPLAKKLGDK